jgi:long-subunit fatty acid transport protein
MRKHQIYVLLGLLLLAPNVGVAADPVGMSYLKIGAGAEATGMGEAVVSNTDGPTATYWNPGALPFLAGFQAGFVHNESFFDVRQEFAGITRAIGRFGVGLSFHGTWVDNLKAYGNEPADFLGTFGYYGVAAGISGGYRLTDRWGVGAGVQLLREAIDVYDASGAAFDFGIQGREILPRLDCGLSVLHLGSSLKYIEQSFLLPMTVQGGVSYHIPLPQASSEALLAVEVRKIRDEDTSLRLGIEYRLQKAMSLRAGYRSALDTEDVSFGLGYRRGKIQADYSYVPFGEDLGSQHRFGIVYRRGTGAGT